MTVYGDLAFFIGAALQAPCLWISLRLTDLRRPIWRCVLFCFSGGVVSVLCLYPSVPLWIPAALFCFCGAWFFRGKNWLGTIKNWGRYCVVSFLSAACSLLLLALFSPWDLLFSPEGVYLQAPFSAVLTAFLISGGALACAVVFRQKQLRQGGCVDCEIVFEDRRIPVRCYYDSGNFLSEPVSGLPVAIVEYTYLNSRCPGGLALPMSYPFAQRFSGRYRVVRCRGVSGDVQMLSAFLPDQFLVNGVPRRAVIAVTTQTLENNGRFHGIFGPDLWEENKE